MAGPTVVTGEVSNSKVAAVFPSEATARAAGEAVRAAVGLDRSQVQIITPHAAHPGRKMEPESHGIFRTIVIAHVRLGIVGVIVGALAFAGLYAWGLPLITQSAWFAGAVMVGFGAVAGLMLGGLVSLRPDHDAYIQSVRTALAEGHSAVVVHAFSAQQRDSAASELRARGGDTTSTL